MGRDTCTHVAARSRRRGRAQRRRLAPRACIHTSAVHGPADAEACAALPGASAGAVSPQLHLLLFRPLIARSAPARACAWPPCGLGGGVACSNGAQAWGQACSGSSVHLGCPLGYGTRTLSRSMLLFSASELPLRPPDQQPARSITPSRSHNRRMHRIQTPISYSSSNYMHLLVIWAQSCIATGAAPRAHPARSVGPASLGRPSRKRARKLQSYSRAHATANLRVMLSSLQHASLLTLGGSAPQTLLHSDGQSL